MKLISNKYVLLITSIVLIVACNVYVKDNFRVQYEDRNKKLHVDTSQTAFYKLHFKNGDIAILDTWENNKVDSIMGNGKLYDFKRNKTKDGHLAFHIDDILIGETNDLSQFKSRDSERSGALKLLIAFNLAINVNCAINPKTCFGSCPTFYVEGNENLRKCNAEGFSHAISPSLADTDIDALQYASDGENFELTLKNEALETHVIDQISLLAIPKSIDNDILQSSEGFYECTAPISPIKTNPNIQKLISSIDNKEYFSFTDTTDIMASEEITFDFAQLESGKKGIVLNFRQSLITTFLLYNSLSYLGDEATDFIAKFESNNHIKSDLFDPILKKSYIKIYSRPKGSTNWQAIEDIYEIGPIAKNKILVPLSKDFDAAMDMEVKIVLPKGHWRLDYVGITNIIGKVEPQIYKAHQVVFNNHNDYNALSLISDIDSDPLMTLPGDVAKLKYQLPCIREGVNYELFVSSTGYYLEWLRREWLIDKDIDAFKKMMSMDRQFWKELSIQYKNQEAEAEAIFWDSSIENPVL